MMAIIAGGLECYECCVTLKWDAEDLVSSAVINYCQKHKAADVMYKAIGVALDNGFIMDGKFEEQFVIGEDDLMALNAALQYATSDNEDE
jgi:hypothetical protein